MADRPGYARRGSHPGGTIRAVTTTRSGPKPAANEERFIPADVDQARELFESIVAHGYSQQKARAIVGTLLTLERPYSRSFAPTMSHYRQILAELGEPPWEGSRVTRRIGGYHNSVTHRRPRYPRPGRAPLALVA